MGIRTYQSTTNRMTNDFMTNSTHNDRGIPWQKTWT